MLPMTTPRRESGCVLRPRAASTTRHAVVCLVAALPCRERGESVQHTKVSGSHDREYSVRFCEWQSHLTAAGQAFICTLQQRCLSEMGDPGIAPLLIYEVRRWCCPSEVDGFPDGKGRDALPNSPLRGAGRSLRRRPGRLISSSSIHESESHDDEDDLPPRNLEMRGTIRRPTSQTPLSPFPSFQRGECLRAPSSPHSRQTRTTNPLASRPTLVERMAGGNDARH